MVTDLLRFLKTDLITQLSFFFFVLFSLWWVLNNFLFDSSENTFHQIFAATYGIMALWGAIWGITSSLKWGGMQSVLGRALLFFSIGLLAQEFGQLAYSYYIYALHIEVPYPSIGDIGYFTSIFFYTFGVMHLAIASGVNFSFGSVSHKLQAVIIPVLLLATAYFFFLRDYQYDWTNPLVVFLDFGYPLGQAFYISLASLTYLLSKKVLGGMLKNGVSLILFALLCQFIADYMFLYQSSRGIWTVGGLNDYLYLVAYLLMTIALVYFRVTAKSLTAVK